MNMCTHFVLLSLENNGKISTNQMPKMILMSKKRETLLNVVLSEIPMKSTNILLKNVKKLLVT